MLKVPSKHEQHALKMAEFFDTLDPDRYDQKHFLTTEGCRCIAGWINYLRCHLPNDCRTASDYLGLDEKQQNALFASHVPVKNPTPKDAARVLRHLAHTGEVDWRAA